jgi:pseudouridine-5'-phosphate glycosidase/pseudouridine kinase
MTQETLGVPVVTYGETQDFPAFYSPSSGFKVGVLFRLSCFHGALRLPVFQSPWRVNDPATAANILCMWYMILSVVSCLRTFPPEVTQWGLGMTHGVLFGVPIPESYTAVGKELQEAVEQAIQESQENGMDKQGKQVTPWLLERVRQLTAGKSLASSKCICASLLQCDRRQPLCRYCPY